MRIIMSEHQAEDVRLMQDNQFIEYLIYGGSGSGDISVVQRAQQKVVPDVYLGDFCYSEVANKCSQAGAGTLCDNMFENSRLEECIALEPLPDSSTYSARGARR